MRSQFALRLAIVSAFVLLTPAQVSAQQRGYAESIDMAKTLMLTGRTADARSLLLDIEKRHRSSNDVDFLLGLLAIDAQDYDDAIHRFRSMLVRQPNAVRVRLELGRAFYLKHDYDNAFRQFQFARAGRLPPGVGPTIDRFLAAIRKEKRWSYSVSIAVAPDTNINNGTSAREVLLFGLPFELNDEARRRSGIGLLVEGAAEFAPRISDTARMRLGGVVQRREYRGTDFDDMTVAFYAGPRLVLDKWDLSATAVGVRRSFGSHSLSEGIGAKLDGTYYSSSRTAWSLTLSAQQVRYPEYPLQNGMNYVAWGGIVRALTPSSSINARVGVSRKTARIPELANWSPSVSAGYYRDFGGGFTIYVEPSLTLSRYDASDPFFGKRRHDTLIELRVAALNRRVEMRGFTPRVSFTWTRRKSSIDIYSFGQRRVEAGFTKSF